MQEAGAADGALVLLAHAHRTRAPVKHFLAVPAEVIMPACVCAVARGQTSLSQQLQLVERRPIAEQAQKRRSDACYECE